MQSFKEDPLKKCPKCHEDALRRLFGTGAAILFKGSGFYETDYRSESYKAAAKKDQEATSTNGTAATNGKTGGESKPSETKATETKPPAAKT